jgi:hypothetical protein
LQANCYIIKILHRFKTSRFCKPIDILKILHRFKTSRFRKPIDILKILHRFKTSVFSSQLISLIYIGIRSNAGIIKALVVFCHWTIERERRNTAKNCFHPSSCDDNQTLRSKNFFSLKKFIIQVRFSMRKTEPNCRIIVFS